MAEALPHQQSAYRGDQLHEEQQQTDNEANRSRPHGDAHDFAVMLLVLQIQDGRHDERTRAHAAQKQIESGLPSPNRLQLHTLLRSKHQARRIVHVGYRNRRFVRRLKQLVHRPEFQSAELACSHAIRVLFPYLHSGLLAGVALVHRHRVVSRHLIGTSLEAVLAPDAAVRIDANQAVLVFGDGARGAHIHATRIRAMHARGGNEERSSPLPLEGRDAPSVGSIVGKLVLLPARLDAPAATAGPASTSRKSSSWRRIPSSPHRPHI